MRLEVRVGLVGTQRIGRIPIVPRIRIDSKRQRRICRRDVHGIETLVLTHIGRIAQRLLGVDVIVARIHEDRVVACDIGTLHSGMASGHIHHIPELTSYRNTYHSSVVRSKEVVAAVHTDNWRFSSIGPRTVTKSSAHVHYETHLVGYARIVLNISTGLRKIDQRKTGGRVGTTDGSCSPESVPVTDDGCIHIRIAYSNCSTQNTHSICVLELGRRSNFTQITQRTVGQSDVSSGSLTDEHYIHWINVEWIDGGQGRQLNLLGSANKAYGRLGILYCIVDSHQIRTSSEVEILGVGGLPS